MTGTHSPRGLWILALVALFVGVGTLSPVWAADLDSGDDGTGIFSPPRGGNTGTGPGSGRDTGGGGGEADPDWWQTDTWTGTQVDALPASDSPRREITRQVYWMTESPFRAFITWLSSWTSHGLGF